jgi:hypothetical protein
MESKALGHCESREQARVLIVFVSETREATRENWSLNNIPDR